MMTADTKRLPEKWTQEADVLVVGAGPAGLRAAAVARDAGAEVLVLEKMDSCLDCALARSGGQLSFAGTEEQKEEGIKDSVDLYAKDVIEGGEYGSDPRIVKAFMDRQLDTYHWLKEQGVRLINLTFLPRNTVKRTLTLDPRELVISMQRTAEGKGARLRFGTQAKRLVTSPEGEVIGVKAESNGKTLYFKGKRATILATGGFGRSPEWLEKCCRGYSRLKSISAPGATGDGLLMALELGAELRGLNWIEPSVGLHEKGNSMSEWAIPIVCGAILVNKLGRRFVNEGGEFHTMGDSVLKQPDRIGFQILDQKIRETARNTGTIVLPAEADELLRELQDDTIAGLAEKAGINPANLRETVDKYNSYVEAGMDPEFGRVGLAEEQGQLVKLDIPPFYAFPTVALIAGTSVAGLIKDENCRAINVFGDIIPRLYLAGEIAIGFHGYRVGTSGSSIVMAIIDGIIAGENAVAEKPVNIG
jgi:fumarate reductase flavoprotein subunit